MSNTLSDKKRARVEQFQMAFNEIEAHLRVQLREKDETPFSVLIRKYGEKNPVWEGQYGDDLRRFAQLRNVLAHQTYRGVRYLSVPVPLVVERIESIKSYLLNEERVIPSFQRPVTGIEVDKTLVDVLRLIRDNDFSQFPVYQAETFKGLLTENGITRWLAKHVTQNLSLVEFEEVKVADLLLVEEERKNVLFVSRNETVNKVTNRFGQNPFLEAVLITQRGRPDEKLLGVVTRWDVINSAV